MLSNCTKEEEEKREAKKKESKRKKETFLSEGLTNSQLIESFHGIS